MPSAAARRLYEDQIPSFMSVFDLDAETMADRETVTVVDPKLLDVEASCVPPAPLTKPPPPPQHPSARAVPTDPTHKHHDSTSTQTSESADSSPTTTLSTTDSSPLSDPSPSSSPDSPVNLIPLASYPASSFGQLSQFPPQLPLPRLPRQEQPSQLPLAMSALSVNDPSNAERPMTSPSPRKPRNMKGLSIQPPFAGSASSNVLSEPASPSGAFIKPKMPPMKKRPSQLSLNTNTSDLAMRNITLEVPSSPAMPPLPPILQRRALKHSASTPHMLSGLKSSTFGPPGGMGFPKVLERNESGLSEMLRPTKLNIGQGMASAIAEEESPIRMQVASRGVTDVEHLRDETENNEDQKSPGYPEGPIAIYDDNVFLYLEPNAEEASRFDLVINVAREVKNPFVEAQAKENEKAGSKMQFPFLPRPTPADDSPIPDTALTAASFQTAFEFPPTEEMTIETPTTPRAVFPPKEPEYIHMLWDHNTDIAPDLMGLCEKVEKTTKEGKKVLIHCQQGASRSASLIIAYGLYRNPELSVNDAYYRAQEKSKWISPNMKLMYCLQDFQKELQKKKLTPASGYRPRTGRSPTKHRLTLSADAIDIGPKEPLTAPILSEEDEAGRTRDCNSPMRPRGASTPGTGPISPGPSSAPSSFSWAEAEDEKDPGKPGRFNLGSTTLGRKIPETESSPDQASKPVNFSRPPPTPGFPGGFAPRSFDSPSGFGFSSLSFGHSMDMALRERPKSRILALPGSFPDTPIERTIELPAPRPVERVKERVITIPGSFPDDSALLSPRVEAMMNHPLREKPSSSDLGGMQFVESPPTPTQGLFSPRMDTFNKDSIFNFGRPTQVADPRSPPTQGEMPIVRSIDELI